MKKLLLILILSGLIIFSNTTWAINIWEGTSGGGCNVPGSGGGGLDINACTLCDGLIVAQNIIMFLFELAPIIAVAMIIWGALVMMFAAGNQARFTKGREIITNAIWGLIIALAAWLIINEVLHLLAKPGFDWPWNQIKCR